MHHVDDFKIFETPKSFDLVYPVEPSGEEIRVLLPKRGAFFNPDKELTREKAEQVGHILRETLNQSLV